MENFPINTFTIVNSENHAVLHSPALPRVGVPYIDVTDSKASRLTIVSYEGAEPSGALLDGELHLTVTPGEFERLERLLVAAPRRKGGGKYPYSVIEEPVQVRYQADNDRVVNVVLPC